jgi:tetratricopeptide (TPR) repeat protein
MPTKQTRRKPTARKKSTLRGTRRAASGRVHDRTRSASRVTLAATATPPQAAPQPAPAPRKPTYYEAISIYETGVRALQRHDFAGAAEHFRTVLERYPEERELHERAGLYLRVCERETARRPANPQTPQERVYAATVALNAGDSETALEHLRKAIADAPDSDHAHYIMATALAGRGNLDECLHHLRRAIGLNTENRALARQDPDFEPARHLPDFRDLLDAPAGVTARPRRRR